MQRYLIAIVACIGALLRPSYAAEPPITPELNVGIVQYPIEGNQSVEQILAKMEGFIQQAAMTNANCVVFPELITFDAWRVDSIESHLEPSPEEISEVKRIATEVTPAYLQDTAKLARKYQMTILAGTTPRLLDNRLFNTALMAFPDGSHILQDKIYPTRWETLAGINQGTTVRVFEAPWGLSTILTCYDIEFPDIATALVKGNRPEVIFVPSMTESQSGLQRVRWCAQARAVELHCFVVISGTVGSPSKDWHHFGQAAAITPRDSLFAEEVSTGPLGSPTLVTTTLDTNRLRTSRATTAFDPSVDSVMRTSQNRFSTEVVKPISASTSDGFR